MNDLVVVGLVVGGDLTSDEELALFQKTLDGHTGVLVMLKNIGHDGICDLVTDFIGMAIADLFTGDNLTHGFRPPIQAVPLQLFLFHLPALRPCSCTVSCVISTSELL